MIDVIITFFLCAVIAVASILVCAYVLTKYILVPYRHRSAIIPPDQLFNFLLLVVENEFEIFDKEVLNAKVDGISNSDYENFYKMLTTSILDGLTDDYVYKLGFYISEEHVAEMISSMVHEHLKARVQ